MTISIPLEGVSKEYARHLIQSIKCSGVAIHPDTARGLYNRAELPLPSHLLPLSTDVKSARQIGKDDMLRAKLENLYKE